MKDDFSYEETLLQEITGKGGVQRKELPAAEARSQWVDMIYDLVIGAGYSYSRIAHRMDVSPSTIQKLATNPNRKPRFKVFHLLLRLHTKAFQGQYATPRARAYWADKSKSKQQTVR